MRIKYHVIVRGLNGIEDAQRVTKRAYATRAEAEARVAREEATNRHWASRYNARWFVDPMDADTGLPIGG